MFLKIQNLHWVEVACQLFIIPSVTTRFSQSCPVGTCLIESMQPSRRWNVGTRFALCHQTQRVVLSFAWHHASRLSGVTRVVTFGSLLPAKLCETY